MTEKITHAEIMLELKHIKESELKHIKDSEDKIEKHLDLLNGKVNSNTIAIACMKASAGTISAMVALIVTSIVTLFSGKIKW